MQHGVGRLGRSFVAPLAAGVALLAGCGLSACADWLPASSDAGDRRVVMWFDEYDEVFTGLATETGLPLMGGFLDMTNHHGDLRCVGESHIRIVPPGAQPPLRCDGVSGGAELTCSDGRQLVLSYSVEEGCSRGYAEGRDDQGHALHAVFGQSASRARLTAREARVRLAQAPRLPERSLPETVGSGGASTGTAFFVSWEGHLVTNYHVIRDRERIHVQLLDGDLAPVRVLVSDSENDLALLQVDAIGAPLPLRGRELVKGEEVFALGYPLIAIQGQEQKATFGRVNALSGARGDARFAQIDVPIQPGNSGGPLLDKRGEVVGVVSSILHPQKVLEMAGVTPQNVNYALKAEHVRDALRENLAGDWTPAAAQRDEREFSDLVSEAQDSVVLVVAW